MADRDPSLISKSSSHHEDVNHPRILLGIMYTIIGTFTTAVGNHLVEKSHALRRSSPKSKREATTLFVIGNVTITVVGTIFGLLGFANAPLLICANLGCLTIVWNAYLAQLPYFGGTRLKMADAWGIVSTLLGATLVISSGPIFSSSPIENDPDSLESTFKRRRGEESASSHFTDLDDDASFGGRNNNNKDYLWDTFFSFRFIAYFILTVALLARLTNISEFDRSVVRRRLASGFVGGLAGGLSNVFAKGVMDALSLSSWRPNLGLVLFAGLALSAAAAQLILLNRALERFSAVRVVPVYQIALLVSATLSGGIAFNEFKDFNIVTWFVFLLGVALSGMGVNVLASSSHGPPGSSSSSASAGAPSPALGKDSGNPAMNGGDFDGGFMSPSSSSATLRPTSPPGKVFTNV